MTKEGQLVRFAGWGGELIGPDKMKITDIDSWVETDTELHLSQWKTTLDVVCLSRRSRGVKISVLNIYTVFLGFFLF